MNEIPAQIVSSDPTIYVRKRSKNSSEQLLVLIRVTVLAPHELFIFDGFPIINESYEKY